MQSKKPIIIILFALLIVTVLVFFIYQQKNASQAKFLEYTPPGGLMYLVHSLSTKKSRSMQEAAIYNYIENEGITSEFIHEYGGSGPANLEGADFDHYSIIPVDEERKVLLALLYKEDQYSFQFVNYMFYPGPEESLEFTERVNHMYQYYKKKFLDD